MDFHDSSWNIAASSAVVLAAADFEISCRKKRTQTNGGKNSTPGIADSGSLCLSLKPKSKTLV